MKVTGEPYVTGSKSKPDIFVATLSFRDKKKAGPAIVNLEI
jgi:hypothetical protein